MSKYKQDMSKPSNFTKIDHFTQRMISSTKEKHGQEPRHSRPDYLIKLEQFIKNIRSRLQTNRKRKDQVSQTAKNVTNYSITFFVSENKQKRSIRYFINKSVYKQAVHQLNSRISSAASAILTAKASNVNYKQAFWGVS